MVSAALGETLDRLVREMAEACDPWWVIGSTAVVAHGAATTVGDVDVLLGERDARRIDARLSLGLRPGVGDGRFRSKLYARWSAGSMAVEFMAGLKVVGQTGFERLRLRGREWMTVSGVSIPVPVREEMVAMLTLFGRAKDLRRAALLQL